MHSERDRSTCLRPIRRAPAVHPAQHGRPPAARAAARGRATVPSELRRLRSAGVLDDELATRYADQWGRAKRTLKKLKGSRKRDLAAVLRSAEQIAGERAPHEHARARSRADGPAQRRLVAERAAAGLRQAGPLHGQPADVAVLPRPGHPDPVARDVRADEQPVPRRRPRPRAARDRARRSPRTPSTAPAGSPGSTSSRSAAGARRGSAGSRRARRSRPCRAPPCGCAIQSCSTSRGARSASSARRRRRASACGRPPEPTTSPTRSPRASGSTTRSSSRSSGCTTSRRSPTTRSGRRLWLDGERQARREVVRADTGSWSLYQPGRLSDIEYHKILRDFVRRLCDRLNTDREREVLELRAVAGPARCSSARPLARPRAVVRRDAALQPVPLLAPARDGAADAVGVAAGGRIRATCRPRGGARRCGSRPGNRATIAAAHASARRRGRPSQAIRAR